MNNSTQKELKNIQVLRFLAAFLVVFAHVPMSQFSGAGIKEDFFGFGAIGVDIFFVISGFIMFYIAKNTKYGIGNAASFLIKRILRVVPLYWLFLVLSIYLSFISVNCPSWADPCPFWLQPNYKFSNIDAETIIRSFTFTNFSSGPIYSVGWTLIYEFWFYVFISATIAFGVNRLNSFAIIVTITLLSYLLKAPITYSLFNVLFNPLMIEFGYGVLLYSVWSHEKLSLKFTFILFVLTNAINLFIFYKFKNLFEHSLFRPIVWGGIAYSMVSLALFSEGKIKIHKYFVSLGDASYSLYLTHWLIVTTLPFFLVIYSIQLNAVLFVLLNVLASIFASIILYRCVEYPLLIASKILVGYLNSMFSKKTLGLKYFSKTDKVTDSESNYLQSKIVNNEVRLEQLHSIFQKGLISQDEFEGKRTEILKNI